MMIVEKAWCVRNESGNLFLGSLSSWRREVGGMSDDMNWGCWGCDDGPCHLTTSGDEPPCRCPFSGDYVTWDGGGPESEDS
jgi:hypothetical protein